MVHRREVLGTGWTGEPPHIDGFDVRQVALEGVATALFRARPHGGAVLLLGEVGLRVLRPIALRPLLAATKSVALAVYRTAPPEEALEWVRSGVADVVAERGLSERVAALARVLLRPEVPLKAWVHRIGAEASFGSLLHDSGAGFRLDPVPLIVSGVGSADLNGQFPAAWWVEVMGLHRALRHRDPPLVVVLGDEALQRLSPARLRPYLRRSACASFGVARVCPAHVVAEWARSCPIHFVPEGQLLMRVAVARRLGGALPADEGRSTSPGRSGEMREALLALQGTRDLRVKSWAGALGTSRHALRRLCAATLRLTPEEITWSFFHARVRREVLHGRNDEQIAWSLGLANGYALRRAYARRGIPFPRA